MVSDRPLRIRLLEIASVAGFAAVSTALALRFWSVPWKGLQLLSMFAGGALGFFIADVASGVVHWFCDTFFQDDTPLIGRAFIRPFREHHEDPLAITRHGFFEVNGNNCLALVPFVAAVLVVGRPADGEPVPALFGQSAAFGFAIATFATNQIHKWAHQVRPAPAVRRLQELGMILTPEHHRRHHASPYRQAYCITTGWLDPMLDSMRLFECIEHVVRRVADVFIARDKHSADAIRAHRAPIARSSGR
jgi:hypothetical protein